MTSFMRFRGSLLVGTACLLALASGDVQADPVVAQRLFLEATALTAQARNEADPARRAGLLERARQQLQAIVTEHGDSPLAGQLGRGETIGTFDPHRLDSDLAAARSAAGKAAAAPSASAQRTRLPMAPVDPKSLAGKVLGDVVGALETALAGDSTTTLSVARPVTAVQSGDTVTLTFPGLRLGTDEESELALGDVRLDVTPQAGNRYAFTLPLPAEIIGTTKGEPAERLTLVAEPISGVWAPDAGSLLRLYVRVRDLALEELAPEPKVMLSIAGLTVEQKGDLQANRLSGDFSMELRDVVANDTSSTQQVRIGRFTFSSQALDFDMDGWRRFSDAMQGNGDASQAALEFLSTGGWAKLGTSMAMDDFVMTEDGQPLASMGGMHLGFDFDARPQAGAVMSVKLGMERMQAAQTPVGDLPAGMIPHSFAIDAALEPVPLQAMAQAAQASLQTPPVEEPKAKSTGEEDEDVGDVPATTSIEDQMLGVMMTAEPTLNVAQASLASDMVQMSMAGALTVDPSSPVMTRGAVSVKVAGLDQVKSYLDVQSKTDKSLKSYVSALVVLRGLGADTRLNGAKAKEFKLQTGEDGAVTINGTPWQALMQSDEQPKKKSKKQPM